MEKVGDSRSSSSSSEPVSPTTNEKTKPNRVLLVKAASSETCLEKIKGVLEKLKETSDIDTWNEETDGTMKVRGCFDPEKLMRELQNEAGDAIESMSPHRRRRFLKVEAESSETCLEKIKGVLEKLIEPSDIDKWNETDGMVEVWGCFDTEMLTRELENEAGDAIKSILQISLALLLWKFPLCRIHVRKFFFIVKNQWSTVVQESSGGGRAVMAVKPD